MPFRDRHQDSLRIQCLSARTGRRLGSPEQSGPGLTLRDLPFIGRYVGVTESQGRELLLDTDHLISSFAEDHHGELYSLDRRGYIDALQCSSRPPALTTSPGLIS